ncbi:hypothetical protein [Paracoccus sp. AK26]|uniref:hypothetical protein n=1 Tax=Paracoccus sp. AK26 TaxID=2589076 RepID=UPI0014285ECE|nr:hypothetical protein [Paracoccus sp. AK26]QIR85006.1 hypothetical protein FIU66_07180 [Paracoccus sp. AK26]
MATEPDLVISAGFSDAQLVKDANRIVAEFRKRGEQAQKAFQDAAGRVTDTQAARAHMRELDRLARSYDPVYKAAKTYEKAVKDLDRALDIGAISQQQYVDQVGAAAKKFNSASNQVEEAGRKFAGGGNSAQQWGWQVGDFAVQVQAGTSAAQAFAQQAPQLLGSMGAWGAIAGAGVAIAVPLGAALYRVATNSETLEDRLKKLNETTDDYTAKAEAAAAPIEVLRQRYGDLADEVQRANSTLALMAGIRARSDALGAARALGGVLGADLNPAAAPVQWDGTVNADRQRMALEQQERAMDRLRAKTGATAEQADRLRMAINRTNSANSLDAVIRDSENLLAILGEMSGNAGADQDFLAGWSQQIQAVMQAAQDQLRATRSEMERVTDQYQTDTDKLKALSQDREVAQKALDEAIRSGNGEAVRAWNDRLKLIDAEIGKTQQLALANDELFQAMQKRLQARFPQLLDGAVEAATGTSLTQWGKDLAASQKGILDLIASRESGGDYNATLDNGRWTGGPQNLVNMTLREIQALQAQMRTPENRALYGNGAGSSALGRYQITGRTLEGLMKELGLTGDELFSREMQDRLATQLVRRRLPQGVEGLRNEWEGLRGVSPAVIQQALGQQSIARLDPELQREADQALKDQVRERERLAKQAQEYGAQLAQNLLTQQEEAKLTARQAEQIAAIKAQRLSEEDEARAIAQVTAEVEQQRTVMMLLADAKRRNVDLDAMLADGSMSYRQAIEALGEAKRADIIATNEHAIAEGRVAESQRLMADMQERTKQGLLDSIVAGNSFTDVLANVAQMFAKVALEAALFNTGSLATGGSGGGILGAAWSGLRGLLGFQSGGYTGSGSPSQIGGFVHKGEYVMSAPAVQRIGLPALEALHRGTSTQGSAGGVHVTVGVTVDRSGNLQAYVRDVADQSSARMGAQINNSMPARVQKINAKPRHR